MCFGTALWKELQQEGKSWWPRLQGVQQQLLSTYGVPLPSIELSCDSHLEAYAYTVKLDGAAPERGLLYPNRWFATGEEAAVDLLLGEWGREPIYGFEGRWILDTQAEGAQQLGCHLLAAEALFVGHLCDRLESRLALCLHSSWVKVRCAALGLRLPGPGLLQCLGWLLEERVSVAPLDRIAEAYQLPARTAARRLQNIRGSLGARIVAPWLNDSGELPCLHLTEGVANRLRRELSGDSVDGWFLGLLLSQIQGELEWAQQQHGEAVLVVADDLRRPLFELLPFDLRRVPVLGFSEVPADIDVMVVSQVGSRLGPLPVAWNCARYEHRAGPRLVAMP